MPRDGQPEQPATSPAAPPSTDATRTTPASNLETATSSPTLPPPKAPKSELPPEFTETDEFLGKAPQSPLLAPHSSGLAPPLAATSADPAQAQSAATLKPVTTPGLPPLATPASPAIGTGASFGDYQVIETIAKGG